MRPAGECFGPAVFVGTARNCARYLPDALQRWSLLAPIFDEAHFIVAENDSTDGTKEILAKWAAEGANRSVLTLDGFAARGLSRSVMLARARNALLDAVRADPRLGSAAFLVVMDMDDASLAIGPRALRRCMMMPGWDGLFANQLLYYNDVWALRDDRRSPDDWVARVAAAHPRWRWLARLRYLTWRNRPIWPWKKPFAVRSAFGGLGTYRLPLALSAAYAGEREGQDICEHVPFNEELTARGARLFLHPGLINMVPMPLLPLFRRIDLPRSKDPKRNFHR